MVFSRFFSCAMFVLFFLYFFVASTFAAGTIPRDGLRLELMLATCSQDTSGNNRVVTATGIAPVYQIDSIYGVPFAQFSGSGLLKVNTAWSATGSDDFTLSIWIKIVDADLSSNQVTNYTTLTSTFFNRWWNWVNATYYDKPMVLLSTKTGTGDASNFRLALSKEWKCSLNNSPRTLFDFNVYSSAVPYHGDIYGIFDPLFDCISLKDGKWHNLIITRKTNLMRILIDWNVSWSAILNLQFSRNWSFGWYVFPIDTITYSLFPQLIKNAIYNAHFYKWWMAWFRLYSRSITDTEIEALGDEYRYAQSELAGAGGIQVTMDKYIKPILYANFRNIPTNLNKDNVIYEYSTSTGIFSPITNITQIGSASWTIDYKIGVDLTGKPDGKMNVVFRVRSADQSFQNIGTVGFMKIDTQVEIIINQPNTDLAIDKTITANVIDGLLYMYQTRGTICDGTITTWDDYSDLTFASKNDNGIRICYKAFFPGINKTIYKLSSAIQWIQSKEQVGLTSGLFTDYALWTKSLYQKPNDTTSMMLDLLAVSPGSTQGTINGVTMTDINGDWLVDFLYSNNATIDAITWIKNNYKAIIVNNWNYTFKSAYKCVNVISNNINTYYWDCADTTR